jgi:antitoxin component YwqK of YwqJK toxin-antitoxin module
MYRYSVFVLLLACVDGKFNSDFLEPEPDPSLEDQDGDGFAPADGDCDDTNSVVFPTAVDICDGIDNNCNEVLDEDSFSWSWDGEEVSWSAGEQVQMVEVEVDKEDWLGEPFADGSIDETQRYVYENGVLLLQTRERGNMRIEIDYSYNEEGWLLKEQWSTGIVVRTVQYGYDSSGNLLRIDQDEDADGTVDVQSLFRYDEGILVEETEFVDGVLERSKTWEYDEGSLSSFVVQEGDVISVYRYSALSENGMRMVDADFDGDGTMDEVYTEWYDDQGRIYKEARDLDGFEGFEQTSSWEYGARGLMGMSRFEVGLGNEEHIIIEELGAHQFTSTHDIDSSFWEQSRIEHLSLSCASQDPKVEE